MTGGVRRATVVGGLVALLVLGVAGAKVGWLVFGGRAHAFRNTDITGAEFGRDFSLVDHTGVPRRLGDYRGKVVVLNFGFTHCPDVCPGMLFALRGVMDKLGADAERVQALMVTVDPERDTPEVLARYVPAFHPRFVGLYGEPRAIASTAKEFKVFYEKRPLERGGYLMDHTAASYVFDPQGRLRLYVRHEDLGLLAGDIRALLAGN